MSSATNRGSWLHIAAFLDRFPNRPLAVHARSVGVLEAARDAAAPGKRSAGAAASCALTLPDGNHGEMFDKGAAV